MTIQCGTVYLVGAGPGDSGLLTLRAKELIAACDVLVYDYLVNPVFKTWVQPDCELVDVGKSPGLKKSAVQQEIQTTLIDRVRQGLSVVRLKGGDPFVFGRGGEEAAALKAAGIPFEIVPGITAALAAAAYAGFPLTHRQYSSLVTFATGHEDPEKGVPRIDFSALARPGGSLAVYMGMAHLPEILERLLSGGLDPGTPAAVVQWATWPEQRIVTGTVSDLAGKVAAAGIGSPAVVLVGPSGVLQSELSWRETGPLAGKRVAVTRSRQQAGRLSDLLRGAGAEVLELPLIHTKFDVDPVAASEVFSEIATYEWLVFTSINGVTGFFELFHKAFDDLRCIGGARIACVGASTARAVREQRLAVDLLPEEANADSLADALIGTDSLESAHVLVIQGSRNDPTLARRLQEEGRAIVDTLAVYKTQLADLTDDPAARRFREQGADVVTFTSRSTVEAWVGQQASLQPTHASTRPKLVSIGPRTSAALREAVLPVAAEAESADLDALVRAVVAACGDADVGA
ncbi:MAG: uroporphyrinogen-III C-methyltransferase [Opitutales bacterium]